ncbi:MAG: hypothetical protein HBSAPP04_15480 [Ignavibacteriaceae bacterium]|nr:MAG: hypothetical protein EDM75_08180 [Chlorobiota bacterium]GJQ32709.1 MAG: hypothetical protein HBSAPP04_15480 [Ignavibacteriaceae bacterium]
MRTVILIFAFFLILDVSGFAQPGPGPGGGRGKHKNRGGEPGKKMEQLEKVKLIEYMNLDEETMVKLFTRRNEHRKLMDNRSDMAEDLIDKMEKLIDDNKDGSKNAELTAAIAKFNSHMEETQRLQRGFITSLSDILTPEALAKYIVFERNFRKELRELLRKD